MDPAIDGPPPRGLLLVVSGPSGSGKSTLVQRLMRQAEFPLTFSISATSRGPRVGETNGVEYQFLDRESFEKLRREGHFLEHAEVHGNFYGTPREPVEAHLAAGRWVLLEIDVLGHAQVKRAMPEAISFFIRTPSIEEYEARLRGRGTETEEAIRVRVADVREQLLAATTYDFQIVNESVEQAERTLRTLLVGLAAQKGETRCWTN